MCEDDGTARYNKLADSVRTALHLCGMGSPPQTRPVGLLQPEHVSPAVNRLFELIEQAAYDLGTGFMGTALLLLTLTAHGHIRLDWFV